MNEQAENLERVSHKIAPTVRLFVSEAERLQMRFTAQMLTDFVARFHPRLAPDSAARILRQERKAGRINYRVVSRSQSLYEALPVQQ